MNIYTRLILAALSTYRLAELFALDNGPYDMFKVIRYALGRKASEGNSTWKTLADLVDCPFCLGIWFAVLAGAGVIYPTNPGDILLILLGIAGLQAFLEGITGKRA